MLGSLWVRYVYDAFFLIFSTLTNFFGFMFHVIALAVSNFCTDYTSQAVFCAVFGVTSGAYVGLTSVVLVDLLGLDKLTNAFGLLLLFQGIASVLGPPIIGETENKNTKINLMCRIEHTCKCTTVHSCFQVCFTTI